METRDCRPVRVPSRVLCRDRYPKTAASTTTAFITTSASAYQCPTTEITENESRRQMLGTHTATSDVRTVCLLFLLTSLIHGVSFPPLWPESNPNSMEDTLTGLQLVRNFFSFQLRLNCSQNTVRASRRMNGCILRTSWIVKVSSRFILVPG